MYYEKPEIDILMFMKNEIITGSLPLENDPFGGSGDDGDIEYDADGV